MPEDCFVCSKSPDVPRHCNHCSKPVCSEHLLPENHDCAGLQVPDTDQEWFDEMFSDVSDDEPSDTSDEIILGKHGPGTHTSNKTSRQHNIGDCSVSKSNRDSTSGEDTSRTGTDDEQEYESESSNTESATRQRVGTKSQSDPLLDRAWRRISHRGQTVVTWLWCWISGILRLGAVAVIYLAIGWIFVILVGASGEAVTFARPAGLLVAGTVVLRLTRQRHDV